MLPRTRAYAATVLPCPLQHLQISVSSSVCSGDVIVVEIALRMSPLQYVELIEVSSMVSNYSWFNQSTVYEPLDGIQVASKYRLRYHKPK